MPLKILFSAMRNTSSIESPILELILTEDWSPTRSWPLPPEARESDQLFQITANSQRNDNKNSILRIVNHFHDNYPVQFNKVNIRDKNVQTIDTEVPIPRVVDHELHLNMLAPTTRFLVSHSFSKGFSRFPWLFFSRLEFGEMSVARKMAFLRPFICRT